MGSRKTIIFVALAYLAFVPGARAQQYGWRITHPAFVPIPGSNVSYRYGFTSVDCYGEVCTAAGNVNGTAFTGTHLMFFRSTNGGLTWADQDPDLPSAKGNDEDGITKVQQIDALDAVGVGFLGPVGSVGDTGFVLRTFNGGLTWNRQDIHTTEVVNDVHFSDPMNGIIILGKPTSYGEDACDIETTNDGGQTWTLAPFSPWLVGANCHSDGGSKFRVVSYAMGPVYSTTDDWNTVDSTPLIIPWADSIHILGNFNFKGDDTIIGYGATGNGTPQILFIDRSIDGGMHWDSVIYSGVAYNGLAMSSLDRDIVFLSVVDDLPHLGVSTDHGMTWQIESMPLDTFVGQNTSAVAVTGRNEAVTIISTSPSQGVLLQGIPASNNVDPNVREEGATPVYPNPASETITITSAGSTKVEVLDILGREVLHETVPSNSPYTLDISSLPDGLYYVSNGHSRAKFVKE
ncbi:MAG TPA: T9SS type A sorting domain-containing protein [Candidatus Kapabacteria bacterium]|nr:T9SS type A sorting domain-containing protein [Candidatus Kapabacteria bacterium]